MLLQTFNQKNLHLIPPLLYITLLRVLIGLFQVDCILYLDEEDTQVRVQKQFSLLVKMGL
jgi:hypothetical protein